MASPLYIAQQIFSQALQKSTPSPSSYQCINGTPILVSTKSNSSSNEEPTAMTSSPHSLVDFFFSSSALIDWFKIFIYGSLLAMFRKLVYNLFKRVYNSFFITATFTEKDISYSWVCFWLSRQPAWRSTREVEVSTDAFGFDSTMVKGEMEDTIYNGSRQLAYLPAEYTVHSMWYKNHWMWIKRSTETRGLQVRRIIELCVLAHSHSVLNEILIESKKVYEEARDSLVGIYAANEDGWQMITACPKRSLHSVILDPGMKETLLEDATNFLASRAWYTARGIPFRRGYLLYGPPGSGKSSIIHSIAGELGLHMFCVSLSKSGMDDTSLKELISKLPEKCIALMEDIDAAFGQTLNRKSNHSPHNDNSDDDDDDDTEKSTTRIPYRSTSKITLSGLLNALDGVGAQEGRILFATTNKYDVLDPALCRPGRMDIHMEFKNASRYQAKELFKCFYMPDSDGQVVEVNKEEEEDACGEVNSSEGEKGQLEPERVVTVTKISGSVGQVEKLAEEFGDAIPERQFSMASLQGYLMRHKVTPVVAVREAKMWVSEEREESRRRKEKRREERRKDEEEKRKQEEEEEEEEEEEKAEAGGGGKEKEMRNRNGDSSPK